MASYVSKRNTLTKFTRMIASTEDKEEREEYTMYGDSVKAAKTTTTTTIIPIDMSLRLHAIAMKKHGWVIGSMKGRISRMEQVERSVLLSFIFIFDTMMDCSYVLLCKALSAIRMCIPQR